MSTQPIRTGSADAVTQLEQRIAADEALQARMKAANLAIRQNAKAGRDAQITALIALAYTEAEATKLLTPDFLNRIGYPDYALTNNSANLRRLKQQLAKAQALAATSTTTETIGNVTITDNVEADRVQISFPSKPSPTICDLLNQRGFHWTPSLRLWQRYRSQAALALAKQIAQRYVQANA